MQIGDNMKENPGSQGSFYISGNSTGSLAVQTPSGNLDNYRGTETLLCKSRRGNKKEFMSALRKVIAPGVWHGLE